MLHVGPIYTIGHSTLPLDAFLAALRDAVVRVLADIRTVPRSRTNPKYNLDSLPAFLAAARIGYAHLARLGGLRGRTDLPQGLSPNTAWRNTRFRDYADYALVAWAWFLMLLSAPRTRHITGTQHCVYCGWWTTITSRTLS